jgi:hypothetical protein
MQNFSSGTSKQLTDSGIVTTANKPGVLLGYVIKVGSTDTVIQFVNGGASGTVKWEDGWNGQTAAGDVYISHTFTTPLIFSTDMYVVISGTGAKVCVEYVEIS